MAVDPTAASPIGSGTAQALVISTETTAPAGISSWSAPATDATGLLIGDLPAGYCRAVWLKRAAADTAALNPDGVTLKFKSAQV